ncbi:dirigent protein 21-like [Triticum urartu]|uniref:dirigent protein 21-like n=1 Tax=Triticum urartu TaxID=4572 RepID=UPI001949994E|nr:dirigent protein 21-like [Triticum urartu]XP_048526810.1 dirigent protein 21-like [Triticum urartu]
MLGRVIFCVVIAAAVLAVVLLATVSPLPHRSTARPRGLRDITVYIHPAASGAVRRQQGAAHGDERVASALVFRHRMTAGPEITSAAVGAASGFVLPGERGSAMSAFDTVHLAFDAPGLSGGLCVEVARSKEAPREEALRVVGGTGAFAFARGRGAVLGPERGRRLDDGGATATALRLELSLSVASAGAG